ncbi:type II secretion system protein GspN [Alteromonas sp. 345S023]|uniref:Type II secretion system protein N n=1 Tax=Alteromonas profundi TaxID=2696062 RepID=A0A7X5LJY7_9ALTE|nr:type II secretion system protein N [Alteromonas profundi]NDV90762.1 type II secretion system protein GspN [Alteromonas profundi]
MKLRVGWILGGIVAFIIFAIAYMPATHLIGRVSLPKGVSVNNVSGTVWSGRAQQAIVNGLPINNLRWEISPLALVTGTLSADISGGNLRNSDDIAFNGNVATNLLSLDHLKAHDFIIYLPVDRVLAQVNLPLPVNAGGRFKVKLDDVSMGETCRTLSGTGDWLNATVAGTQGPIDFGTYSATLRCEGDDIGILVSEPNLLGLSMDAVVAPNLKRISVEGKFKPDESLPDEVHQASRFFGQPNNDGYIAIKL